jgi:hypothetical protein
MALLGKDATVTGAISVVAGAPDPEGDAGGVLVVLRASAVWMGTATVPVPGATKGTKLGAAFTLRGLPRVFRIAA